MYLSVSNITYGANLFVAPIGTETAVGGFYSNKYFRKRPVMPIARFDEQRRI